MSALWGPDEAEEYRPDPFNYYHNLRRSVERHERMVERARRMKRFLRRLILLKF